MAQIARTWIMACGDCSDASQKREYGFWIRRNGNGFEMGRIFGGDYPTALLREKIDAYREALPGAFILQHVHPNRIGENFARYLGISLEDRQLAGELNAVVYSLARGPDGRLFFDYVDTMYTPPGQQRPR
jgi:hypothetical protein